MAMVVMMPMRPFAEVTLIRDPTMATQNQVASATDHQPDEVINWSDDEDNEDNSGNGAASSDPFAASHSETDGLVISSSTEGINEDEALADAPDSAFDQ
ncbi:hypothetical protein HDU82_001950 [Entophlyctis luteolus]|nr:hypothetical protein HDU82_001950 [Entophlyctis luteolus]